MGLGTLARAVLPAPIAEPLRDWWADRRAARELARYRELPSLPPPHAYKVWTVLEHGRRFGLERLIETGTYEGEMARRCHAHFRDIVTIELDPELARRATRRLARFENIRVIQGDSATRLAEVLREAREPAVFWLDGHYSGPGTARGQHDTPLVAELRAIAARPMRHVVLIDDARLLGTGEYPSLHEVERMLKAAVPGASIEMGDDIVRCTPARA